MLRTWSGKLAPLTLDDGEVCILDLVVVGQRVGRFGNNGDPTWNVLQHQYLTSLIALRLGYGPAVACYCTVHDMHEPVLGFDPPKPVKEAIRDLAHPADPLKELEWIIDRRVFGHLNLPEMDEETKIKVKECDTIAGVVESVLFGPIDCDLNDVLPEDQRPDMLAKIEKVIPGFQKLVRRRQ